MSKDHLWNKVLPYISGPSGVVAQRPLRPPSPSSSPSAPTLPCSSSTESEPLTPDFLFKISLRICFRKPPLIKPAELIAPLCWGPSVCERRHVPKAQAWIRLRGRDRGGGLSRPEIAFRVPVPDKDPGHRWDCSSPLWLAGVEGWVGGRPRGSLPGKDTWGPGRGVPCVWAAGGAAGRRG